MSMALATSARRRRRRLPRCCSGSPQWMKWSPAESRRPLLFVSGADAGNEAGRRGVECPFFFRQEGHGEVEDGVVFRVSGVLPGAAVDVVGDEEDGLPVEVVTGTDGVEGRFVRFVAGCSRRCGQAVQGEEEGVGIEFDDAVRSGGIHGFDVGGEHADDAGDADEVAPRGHVVRR